LTESRRSAATFLTDDPDRQPADSSHPTELPWRISRIFEPVEIAAIMTLDLENGSKATRFEFRFRGFRNFRRTRFRRNRKVGLNVRSRYSSLMVDVQFRSMDLSAMTRNAASLMRRFLRTLGVVAFLALCLHAESTSFAADFDADRHAESCGCGTKCRREKCCCGPSEDVAGKIGADPTAIRPPPGIPIEE